MADPTIELLEVIVTGVAFLATASSVIYTWVWLKTNPKTWTLTGMTSLLWSFMLVNGAWRYVLAVRDPPEIEIARIEIFFGALIIIGYLMFLYGTYNSGPICAKKKKG